MYPMSGYWQVELDNAAKEKTAFITYDGLYHFETMTFGFVSTPATFQRLMESVLYKLNYKIALCYR